MNNTTLQTADFERDFLDFIREKNAELYSIASEFIEMVGRTVNRSGSTGGGWKYDIWKYRF